MVPPNSIVRSERLNMMSILRIPEKNQCLHFCFLTQVTTTEKKCSKVSCRTKLKLQFSGTFDISKRIHLDAEIKKA